MPILRQPKPSATAWDDSKPNIHAVAVMALLDPRLPARHGNCYNADPEMFFVDTRLPGPVAEAKAICDGCPIQLQCLAVGMGETTGIWGGHTPSERLRLVQAA